MKDVTALAVKDLRIRYGRKLILKNISWDVETNSVWGVFGRNSAGKSTLFKALAGYMPLQTKSAVTVFGEVVGSLKSRRLLSFLPDSSAELPGEFRVGEYLSLMARMRGDSSQDFRSASSLMSRFDLLPQMKTNALSQGTFRRFLIASAFIGESRLIILDEPFNGLDVIYLERLKELVREFQKSGGTLIISGHQVGELAQICTDFALVVDGNIVGNLSASALPETLDGKNTELTAWVTRLSG